jgi:hypothetical protein
MFIQSMTGCSFQQYIGATPIVDSDRHPHVTAEKIVVDDPNCTGRPRSFGVDLQVHQRRPDVRAR